MQGVRLSPTRHRPASSCAPKLLTINDTINLNPLTKYCWNDGGLILGGKLPAKALCLLKNRTTNLKLLSTKLLLEEEQDERQQEKEAPL